MASSESPEEVATRILCTSCFHQTLWLPSTADHPKLRVTFSTTTNFADTSLPVILFITPLFGTRWSSPTFDKPARDAGVRVIAVDRPGFGGSTPVSLDMRVKVWLETVPVLLSHLSVSHVALVTHSAGAIYTLNTLAQYPEILSPRAPYVGFLAPFVPKENSHANLPRIASLLPSGAIGQLSSLSGFFATRLAPSFSWSAGILSFSSPDATTPEERYGLSKPEADKFEALLQKYKFAESVTGGDEDAKLCLGKGRKEDWGVAADYRDCIAGIAGRGRGLEVETYFAESDVMIGEKGREFFESCWKGQEGVVYKSEVCEGLDHDAVLNDFKKGGFIKMFKRVAELGV